MKILEGARAVVFDFDGTLVDSNEIKWKGFEVAFADYPQQMERIRAYCRSFNHTIRGEKFRHVTEQILGLEYTPELERRLHDRYAEYTTSAVVDAAEIPGARKFVESVAHLRPALLSSTPHLILLEILERRGWRSLFETVQGAPVSKREWLIRLKERLNCDASAIVFFGDTTEDETSAREAGCRFVRIGASGFQLLPS